MRAETLLDPSFRVCAFDGWDGSVIHQRYEISFPFLMPTRLAAGRVRCRR